MIDIKSEKEIKLMKEAGNILKELFFEIENSVKPGITTLELNAIAENIIKKHKAEAAFKGVPCPYKGGKPFKHALCLSVNEDIIHGVPDNRTLEEGDVLCLDVGVYKNGYYSDAGRTYIVGNVDEKIKDFVNVAKEAFFEGIKYAKEGNRVGDISNAIQTYVENKGYTLLREYQGHGIGKELHEEPGVPNIGKKGTGPRLYNGMTIAIEPMICMGSNNVYVKKDKWTVATKDNSLTAYYENTILITKDGVELLTY